MLLLLRLVLLSMAIMLTAAFIIEVVALLVSVNLGCTCYLLFSRPGRAHRYSASNGIQDTSQSWKMHVATVEKITRFSKFSVGSSWYTVR